MRPQLQGRARVVADGSGLRAAAGGPEPAARPAATGFPRCIAIRRSAGARDRRRGDRTVQRDPGLPRTTLWQARWRWPRIESSAGSARADAGTRVAVLGSEPARDE